MSQDVDDAEMRLRLQRMVAYRHVCASVRAGATHTLVNAAIMLGLTYAIYTATGPDPILIPYLCIGLAELAVGVWKKWRPSIEAVVVDGLVLGCFGLSILGREFLAWQGIINWRVSPISVLLGIWWTMDAVKTIRAYGDLRRAFPERPSAELTAWFDDLIHEIRAADPQTDDLALDLPTSPKMRAKLFGSTAFFVPVRGDAVIIAGPDEFDIRREKTDHGTGYRMARLRLHGERYPEFEIDDASWENYQKWLGASTPPEQQS
jgi:hypothetical protein